MAIVLHEPDAILLLGLIVAKEMGYETPIALRLDRDSRLTAGNSRFRHGLIAVSVTRDCLSVA